MPRTAVVTRSAGKEDIPVLVGLWNELGEVGGRAERAVNPTTNVVSIEDRLGEVLVDPACRVVLATVDGEPAGMAVLRGFRPDPLADNLMVQIAHVVVTREQRRRGVGHALVAAAAEFAEEHGIEYVATGVFPSLREAARFYARLGFAPALVQRVAPVAVLRRRLGADTPTSRADHLIRRRTRLRRPLPVQRERRPAVEPAD